MGNIAVLEKHMINMIAAGEVIERPANVVKELLENSIDAQAQKITLNIEQGGIKLIKITDDGKGMDAEDLRTAFEPHATSKIKNPNDLDKIATMGFRGEALASIAQVAHVKATSRPENQINAHSVEIDHGRHQPLTPCSANTGTTVEVRNLFYKIPARKKFLRTPNTEMTHINEHFTRIALAYPDLDLTLTHNNRQTHRLLPGQSIPQRIEKLLGPVSASELLETHSNEKNLNIRAFLAKPHAARSNSKYQYVFLNKRYIKDKFISHAIRQAYRGLIEHDKYPVVFIFLQMDPSHFDVNVHPTKIEVRFQNSNLVHSQILAVIRDKLLSTNLDTKGTIPKPQQIPIKEQPSSPRDTQRNQRINAAMQNFFKKNSAVTGSQQNLNFKPSAKNFSAQPTSPKTRITQQQPASLPQLPNNRKFVQIHNTYILTQTKNGLSIIDQHALHEKILYVKMRNAIEKHPLQSQNLLMPETIEIEDSKIQLLDKNCELFQSLGIKTEPFGPSTIAVHAFPTILQKIDIHAFMKNTLDMMEDETIGTDKEKLLHEILDMASCKAAIKANQPLSDPEIQQLLDDKELLAEANRCPHGRPTTIEFSISQLKKQFKRT
jgi:DNA mismatch repair protein MutL